MSHFEEIRDREVVQWHRTVLYALALAVAIVVTITALVLYL